jgi:hypothetical protein
MQPQQSQTHSPSLPPRAARHRRGASLDSATPPPPPPPPPPSPPRAQRLAAAAIETELLLRLGTLSSDERLASAESAARRLQHLLSAVVACASQLGTEPQSVFSYLVQLMRSSRAEARVPTSPGAPLSPESPGDDVSAAAWPAADAALGGRQAALEMAGAVAELRGTLRIKVSDTADIGVAERALRAAVSFFEELRLCAAQGGVGPGECLARLRAEAG